MTYRGQSQAFYIDGNLVNVKGWGDRVGEGEEKKKNKEEEVEEGRKEGMEGKEEEEILRSSSNPSPRPSPEGEGADAPFPHHWHCRCPHLLRSDSGLWECSSYLQHLTFGAPSLMPRTPVCTRRTQDSDS